MAQGIPSLKGFQVSEPKVFNVADFEEDADNVNEHSDVDLKATADSMDQFGQVENLVVDIANKRVIGGNGRLRMMKERGWKTFVGIAVEGNENQIASLAIALNKTGRLSDFDYSKLTAKLQELQHSDAELLALTGFQEHELVPLLSSEAPLVDNLDELSALEEPKKGKEKAADLDARGITLQFNTRQKVSVDAAILKYRTASGDFSAEPADCLCQVLEEYVKREEQEE